MTRYGVVLFHTTSSAMQSEKLLKRKGYPVKLIPTPRQFSSDCGIALRFDWNQSGQIKSLLDEGRVEFDTVHALDG